MSFKIDRSYGHAFIAHLSIHVECRTLFSTFLGHNNAWIMGPVAERPSFPLAHTTAGVTIQPRSDIVFATSTCTTSSPKHPDVVSRPLSTVVPSRGIIQAALGPTLLRVVVDSHSVGVLVIVRLGLLFIASDDALCAS